MKIEQKNIVLTGSRSGIGLALAKALARRGVNLHLIQRQWDPHQVEELKNLGATLVKPWTCDLRDTTEVLKLGEQLADFEIDLLINNAGVLTGDLLERQTSAEIVSAIQVNLLTAILLTKALLPGMLKRRSGLIVNNTSVSAVMRFPCASTYAASKAGLLAFTDCLEAELAGTGVKTLALITPGIDTGMFAEMSKKYAAYIEAPQEKISADLYAQQVLAAIESGQSQLIPGGSTRAGLFLAKHSPWLFNKLAARSFKRN